MLENKVILTNENTEYARAYLSLFLSDFTHCLYILPQKMEQGVPNQKETTVYTESVSLVFHLYRLVSARRLRYQTRVHP